MANHAVVKCPLCEGHGHLPRAEMLDRLADPNLSENLTRYSDHLAEEASATVGASSDFQKEVHTWNPQMPIWRRSPKE